MKIALVFAAVFCYLHTAGHSFAQQPTLVVAQDQSGSVNSWRMRMMRLALRETFQRVPVGFNVHWFRWAARPEEALWSGEVTPGNRESLLEQAESAFVSGGGTYTGGAIVESLKVIDDAWPCNSAILIITDADRPADRDVYDSARDEVNRRGVRLGFVFVYNGDSDGLLNIHALSRDGSDWVHINSSDAERTDWDVFVSWLLEDRCQLG